MLRIVIRSLFLIITLCYTSLVFVETSSAESTALTAHWRDRPPYLLKTEDNQYQGILVDILETAAQEAGYEIRWKEVPFARSLQVLQANTPAIVPRMRITEERAVYSNYIGPVAFHRSQIYFLVKRADKDLIQTYSDLRKYTVGVKRGTVYGKVFDEDKAIKRLPSIDDDNMARMFGANRFRIMAIADKKAIEQALKKAGHKDYVFSSFVITNGDEGYYYGVPKTSPRSVEYEKLNQVLQRMLKSKETREYFDKYGVGDQFWFEQLTPEEIIYSTQ